MRIGIEAQRIFRTKKHGMDIYALQLIRHLQEIDQVNEYFIFVKPDEDVCIKNTSNFEIVQVNGLTYADWEQVWLPQSVNNYNLDVLHCTSNTAPLNCCVPTIVTIHDIIYLNNSFSGGTLYQQLGHYYRKWLVPRVYKQATKVLTVSNFEADTIKEHFSDIGKLEVSYNGINPQFRKQQNQASIDHIRQDLQLPEEYILFLGNIAPKKNMMRVLDAFAKYRLKSKKPVPLVVVETEKLEVLKMLVELGISETIEDIHCTGYVSNDKLPAVYAQASLFLYPSLRESFGIPIIEAMASGTPVITSITSSMPEIGKNAAHYVDPNSTNMLSKKMIELMCNKRELIEMAKKGLHRAKDFSWSNTAKQVLSCYQKMHYGNLLHKEAS